MINIAAPGRIKIIGFSMNAQGSLQVRLLAADSNNEKEKLVDNGKLSGAVVEPPPLKIIDGYLQNMASFIVPGQGNPVAINIKYVPFSGGKAPSKFSTGTQNLLRI
jgi:hypothetical protein